MIALRPHDEVEEEMWCAYAAGRVACWHWSVRVGKVRRFGTEPSYRAARQAQRRALALSRELPS